MKIRFLLIPIILLSMAVSCRKTETPAPETAVLKTLAAQYKNGEISRCTHEGKTVYSCQINAYDAPGMIYDAEGKEIGTCNYAWGKPDPICDQLQACVVIYRVHPNIWGKDAVNNLGFTP